MEEKDKNIQETESEKIADDSLEEAEKNEDKEFEGIENEESDNEIDVLHAAVQEVKDANTKLSDENAKLKNELDAVKDRLLRNSAEYENYRKRTVKEKESIYTDACEDVLKNILPVLDNIERAAATEGSIDDLKKGIDMTIRQFKDALAKLQVEEISAEGQFDPNFHNAVMHVEDDKYENNVIVEVFQKGYKRANKVLRYSMVKVAN